MWKIGHRGACGYAAENSIASFQKALDLGVDALELDVHCSADGTVMVIHDATLDRTTNSHGLVQTKTSIELKTMGIPTLLEVIDLVRRRVIINIEFKSKEAMLPTLSLLNQRISEGKNSGSDFLLSSFDWDILAEIAAMNLGFPLGVLYEDLQKDPIAFAQNIRAYSLHPDYKLLTFETVKSIQQKGFKIYPWTVNALEDIERLKSWQVDGIISDFPDRL